MNSEKRKSCLGWFKNFLWAVHWVVVMGLRGVGFRRSSGVGVRLDIRSRNRVVGVNFDGRSTIGGVRGCGKV